MDEGTLERARAGDGEAFRQLVEPHLRELRLHCHRMLGSLADAEDVLQETLLAAWRGVAGFEGRASTRTWLYKIATNRCLTALRDLNRRRRPEPVPPFAVPDPSRRGEVTWPQPYRDVLLERAADGAPGPEARYAAREAVELAFIVALQRLPPRQAAVLLLRDVLGYAGEAVAAMLETSPTAIKGILQRARASIERHHRSQVDRERPPSPGSRQERDIIGRFAVALIADDIEGVVALLTDDAWLAMPPGAARVPGPSGDRFVPLGERGLAPAASAPASSHPREHPARVRPVPDRHRPNDRPPRASAAEADRAAFSCRVGLRGVRCDERQEVEECPS